MSTTESPTAVREAPAPASSSSIPHLDLRPPREERRVVDVLLRPSSLEAGLHTQTCPHCGVNPAGPPVKRTFQYVPPWVYIGLLLNILVLIIMYMAGRRVVKGELTLCADCDAADTRGRRIRSGSLFGIFGFPLLFALLGGVTVGEDGAIIGGLVGIVAFIAGLVAAHRQTRFDVIAAKIIDKKKDTMTLSASPAFARVLAEEAPSARPVR